MSAQIWGISRKSGDRRQRQQFVSMRLGGKPDMGLAVGTARATGLGAGTKGLVDDLLDGARAAAALRTAAEAAVDLFGIPGKIVRAVDRTADVVVGQNIAGTDNHGLAGSSGHFSDADIDQILKCTMGCKRKNLDFKQFQTADLILRTALKALRHRDNFAFASLPF